MQRFLVGSRDTSHFKIIPVLGYSSKYVISAVTSGGGNRRGNRASREVFPLCCIQSSAHRERCRRGWTRRGLFQLQSAPRLTDRALRAALFAARTNWTPSARRSMAVPWRERPRDLTGFAVTPAATAEVAHATNINCHSRRRCPAMGQARERMYLPQHGRSPTYEGGADT